MPCLHPLKAWRSKTVNPSGKRGITFNPRDAYIDMPIEVPCGQCIECRLERSRQWAMRCMHESTLHADNCFITLTYDDDHLPYDQGLCLDHLQKFFKRIRKYYEKENKRIRYFACGEYGDNTFRPHYHCILFGVDFADKQPLQITKSGSPICTSDILSKLWQHGNSSIGQVTFDSCAYVARYITKKLNVSDHSSSQARSDFNLRYETVNLNTGEVYVRKADFIVMSRRPGIGKGWYDKYCNDVYPRDYIVLNGKSLRPPLAYDRWCDSGNHEIFRKIKHARIESAKLNPIDPERLEAREVIIKQRNNLFKRDLS
jgi:hypothetical protein